MNKRLRPEEVIYNEKFNEDDYLSENTTIRDIGNMYKDLERAIQIRNKGYNVYIIDEFNDQKEKQLIKYINELLKEQNAPSDICYISDESQYSHTVILKNGFGEKFVSIINEIKEYYSDLLFNFYNKNMCNDNENNLEDIEKEKIKMIDDLLDISKQKGFFMKVIDNGFTFIPIKDDREMTEEEYEKLSESEKTHILNSISELKNYSKKVFKELNDIEVGMTNKFKVIFSKYIKEKSLPLKNKCKKVLFDDKKVKKILDNMFSYIEDSIIDNFTMNYEKDESKINAILDKFKVKLIVDNKDNKEPMCIIEHDPIMDNLIGKIEYNNNNGVYHTDVTLVKAGSLIKANNGCLIIKIEDILSNRLSYYYLKKCLLNGSVNINYNYHYFDILSLDNIEFEPIPINTKVILIGDYKTYSLLYKYDKDFKKIFKLKVECDSLMKISRYSKKIFMQNINNIIKKNSIVQIKNDAMNELLKYSSRIAEDRNKIYFSDDIERVIILSNSNSKKKNKCYIDKKDIVDVIREKDTMQKYIMDNYIENKQFIKLNGEATGQINGLSVIDLGYKRFGKPVRITCSCYYGTGNIFDVQSESNLGGDIYVKSVNTLKGCITNLLGQYSKPCVDFHINFEQLYGTIDGDSAAIAELIAMISSLGKLPVKQNIAITGSVDQFGKVQPVGGINEKIESFYEVCKNIDTVSNKGVIIPSSNVNNIILNSYVERSVIDGEFCIYSVDDIFDAMQILMGKNKEEIMEAMHCELKKYYKNKKSSY